MAEDRPDEQDRAFFDARNASETDAATWKARIEVDPQDMRARAAWIGWRMHRDLHAFIRSTEFIAHMHWLVENQPGSTLTSLVATLGSNGGRGSQQAALRRAWLAALEQHADDVRVLKNAASYFGLQDEQKTHELLLAVRARCKEDPGAEWSLASHWLLRARRYQSKFDAVPFAFEREFDSAMGRRALEHAERAIELGGTDSFNEWYEVTRIEAAAAAGAWERATEVARAALTRIADGSTGRVTGNIAYHANRILGHAAVRRADLPAARMHLLACCSGGSSPQLGSFGPDWSLARELLERGERGAVLEFLGQCRLIWPRHDDDLDLWELQIQRGETCTFDRDGMCFARLALPSGAKSKAASTEDEPDDRDPTERAFVAGLRADEGAAREWLAQVRRDPEDLIARASWLGWAGRHRDDAGVLDEVRPQLEWLLENKPGHPFAGHAGTMFTQFGRRSLRRHLDEIWTRHTQHPDVRPEVLGNAASHFLLGDRELALELLERAAGLDPTNPKWPAQSALVRLSEASSRSTADRFGEHFDESRCEDAWIDAERAYALAKEARPDSELLSTLMKAAAGAKRWDRASEIARDTLARMPGAPILRVRREKCLHVAHLILGLAALVRGDRDEARSRLRASVACLSVREEMSVHPNALLALELLALGERETMVKFLESARPLCPGEQAQIDLWQKQLRAGRNPKLDFRWLYL